MRAAGRAAQSMALAGALLAAACSKDPAPPQATPGVSADPVPVKVAEPDIEPPRPAQLAHVTIKALGMYCEESCPAKVRYALADITAVYELGFDPANESIFVSYDATLGPAKQVTRPMIQAIKGAGFDPWLAKETWPDDAKVQVVLRKRPKS